MAVNRNSFLTISLFMNVYVMVVYGKHNGYWECAGVAAADNDFCGEENTVNECLRTTKCRWIPISWFVGQCRGGKVNDAMCNKLPIMTLCQDAGCTWRHLRDSPNANMTADEMDYNLELSVNTETDHIISDYWDCTAFQETDNDFCAGQDTKKSCTKQSKCRWTTDTYIYGGCRGGVVNGVVCDRITSFRVCGTADCTWSTLYGSDTRAMPEMGYNLALSVDTESGHNFSVYIWYFLFLLALVFGVYRCYVYYRLTQETKQSNSSETDQLLESYDSI